MENNNSNPIAPFIMKTYQMVNDPTTESLITWGKANNSFLVVEPLEFSHRILPVHFKHSNFSSFVRQLNTYGFRKVDPDRWEFANEWFLRGQKHLLKNIIRKKHNRTPYSLHKHADEEEDEEEMLMEITRLKVEQRDMEIEIERMNKRLEATEKRPQQMINFLYRVADDPGIIPRLVLEKERFKRLSSQKKRRLALSSLSLSPPPSSSVDPEVGISSSISSSDIQFCGSSPSPETPSNNKWLGQSQFVDQHLVSSEPFSFVYNSFGPSSSNEDIYISEQSDRENDHFDSNDVGYIGRAKFCPPPYPFSLFRGGF